VRGTKFNAGTNFFLLELKIDRRKNPPKNKSNLAELENGVIDELKFTVEPRKK
jgi:hypothetical protein